VTDLDDPSDTADRFKTMIADKSFPCVGAKSALGRGQLDLLSARSITSAWDDIAIHEALMRFAWAYRENPTLFRSFAVLFDGPDDLDEAGFEAALWSRLQSLTDKDEWRGQAADPRVSSDPADPHFGMSFGGEAFFIVGLHPHASRPARRFDRPAIVFNLHDQFELLREQNRYEQLRASIIERDVALAGSVNPMLSRHGETSEARQYSGRAVGEGWRCPFHRSGGTADADMGVLP
jgi:uncharacterized protein